jgi:membrane protein YdbS with pleckstrin-like domain
MISVSEKEFPVQKWWIVKLALLPIVGTLLIAAVAAFVVLNYPYADNTALITYAVEMAVVLVIILRFLVLEREGFHFAVVNDVLVVSLKVLSMERSRRIPLRLIGNITVQQGPLDKIFGLFPLVMELTLSKSEIGSLVPLNELFLQYARFQFDLKRLAMGAVGDMIIIPGLSKYHAETLKNLLLAKKSTTSGRATPSVNLASQAA